MSWLDQFGLGTDVMFDPLATGDPWLSPSGQQPANPLGSIFDFPSGYIAWDPSMPYPGANTGDPASDALSRGVPPGYVAQLYGPAFPAPAGVGPLTRVPDDVAALIGSGGPYYVVGASLAQHFQDESHITTALPPAAPWSLDWKVLAVVGVAVIALASFGPKTLVLDRRS